MHALEKPKYLPPIGYYSPEFKSTLSGYSFSERISNFTRELKDFPFALGQVLDFNIPNEGKANKTSMIALLAERIVSEWLQRNAEYSFQPFANHIYRTDQGKSASVETKGHDFTVLDQGAIFNIELKFIVSNGLSRKTGRFQRARAQLEASAELLHYLSSLEDPDSPIKPKNIIVVVRKKPSQETSTPDSTISHSRRIYQKMLDSAQTLDANPTIPRMILSYNDLTRIFKNLYPKLKATKSFKGSNECFSELETFRASLHY